MKKTSLIAGALLLAAGSANAADLSYSYVDFGYDMLTLDVAGTDLDGDRMVVEGSFDVTNMLFVEGGYNASSFDDFGVELNIDQIYAGIGAHHSLSPNADVYGSIGFLMDDSEVNSGFGNTSDDDTGYYLRPGIRGMVGNNVELFGEYQYVDIYDDSSTSFELGGRYYFNSMSAVTLKYITGDYGDFDYDGFGLGVRVGF